MSYTSTPYGRKRNLFDPSSIAPFKLSRSKIELFTKCARCFYLDRRLGIAQPPGFPFNLNSAVDHLLKKEFDIHRAKKRAHPLMKAYGLDAVPYAHEQLDEWRDPFRGITYHHEPSNLLVTGGVDDIWINPSTEELIIVDYKATSKDAEVSIDAAWQDSYKRQMEVYQWLFRQNGYPVSNTGFFVYCNGKRDAEAFDARLEFDIKLIPYEGSDEWLDSALRAIRSCLAAVSIPSASSGCDYCRYVTAVGDALRNSFPV